MVKNHLFHYPRTIKLVNLNKIKFIKIKLPQLSFLFTLSNRFIYRFTSYSLSQYAGHRIPTVKLKIPGEAFLKSESRTSVTLKL